MDFDKLKELKVKYDELLDFIIKQNNDPKITEYKASYSNDELNNNVLKFCEKLESDKKIFKLFVNRQSRIFGSK